ncbi:MAG: hypothetical protein MI866_00895 [Bacteroidales bacterium]|nr:hypothetical protein [Bacteroidales bacterium]
MNKLTAYILLFLFCSSATSQEPTIKTFIDSFTKEKKIQGAIIDIDEIAGASISFTVIENRVIVIISLKGGLDAELNKGDIAYLKFENEEVIKLPFKIYPRSYVDIRIPDDPLPYRYDGIFELDKETIKPFLSYKLKGVRFSPLVQVSDFSILSKKKSQRKKQEKALNQIMIDANYLNNIFLNH